MRSARTAPAFEKTQIVFLSSIDWEAAWQRHQIFASRFAQAGHEVFFMENSGFRNPGWADLPRLRRRLVNLTGASGGTNPVPKGLRLITPRVLPPTFGAFRWANSEILVPQLADELAQAGLRPNPVVVCYHATATTLALIERLAPSLLVYDCASNFRAHPFAPADFAEQERELLSHAQLVVCDSDYLYEQKKGEHADVVQIHQGVSEAFFQAKPPSGRWDSFCFYGTWAQNCDPSLMTSLSRAGFSVTVSGFTKGGAPVLPPEVRRLAPVPQGELVGHLEGFDCFTLPYRLDPFMAGVIPAKIYEMLAMGRPVITTPLPSLTALKDLIHIAETPQQWAEAARDLPRRETPRLREARIAEARRHTHEAEFKRLYEECRRASQSAPPPPAPSRDAWWAGPHLRAFLRGFSWIGLFYGFAKACTLLTQVVAGRLLGPQQYGQANLVTAVAAFLQILPIMGFPLAMSKFLSEEVSEKKRRAIISTGLTSFVVWASLILALFGLFHRPIAARFSVSNDVLIYSIIVSFLTSFYIVVSSPLLGLRRFAERGVAEGIYGVSAPIFLVLLTARGVKSYDALIIALCMSLVLSSTYSIWCLRSHLKPAFDPRVFRTLSGYAVVGSLNLLTTACVLAPARLILNHHFSTHEVGIFSAYFTTTAQISLAILYIVGSVLVPVASSREGQADAWTKFRRMRIPLLGGAFLLFLATGGTALALFGKKYPFDWMLLLIFALASALILIQGITASLYSARDFTGLRISALGSLMAGLTNVALSWFLIPQWGILGAAVALVGGYTAALSYYARKS